MIDNIIAAETLTVNILEAGAEIMTIDAFDKKGEWFIEVLFTGGAKAITPATADEITQIESDLKDRGWQVDASLFHRGFNAKPVAARLCIPCQWGDHCGACSCCAGYDEDGFIFASSADLWPEGEYALEMVQL